MPPILALFHFQSGRMMAAGDQEEVYVLLLTGVQESQLTDALKASFKICTLDKLLFLLNLWDVCSSVISPVKLDEPLDVTLS